MRKASTPSMLTIERHCTIIVNDWTSLAIIKKPTCRTGQIRGGYPKSQLQAGILDLLTDKF